MVGKQFKVLQTSTHRKGDLWDWSLWIEPADPSGDLAPVRAVTYGLHPAFPNPNRVIRNPNSHFRVEIGSQIAQDKTWGRFTVRVSIALAGGERELHVVPLDLVFPDDQKTPAPDLLPLPAGANYETAVRYAELLMKKSAFGYVREVLDRAKQALQEQEAAHPPEWVAQKRLWIAQQAALCTYKDPTLPNDTRLRQALEILQKQCGLSLTACTDSETLGLGGAIYKRLWDADRSLKDLETSLAYYRRGYRLMLARKADPNSAQDDTYDAGAFTGANVFYLCEVLALEMSKDVDLDRYDSLLTEADTVRRQLTKDLLALQKVRPTDWWIAATLLDAYFGLACKAPEFVPMALEQARHAAQIEVSPWAQQSTGYQLLRAARLQVQLQPAAAASIEALLAQIVATAFRGTVNTQHVRLDGKLGLALSGGGFRASLFHIGVLARMAELDLLRHVEVLSCVSGGSIVGAHYYLLLRHLLQTVPDGAVTQRHYIDLVQHLLEQFLAGVQTNIRMRVAASLPGNLGMIFCPNTYSRTERLGRLYETHLYERIQDGEQDAPRWLNEIFITPKSEGSGHEDGFSPKLDNWRRGAKVPMLVLNATTLNTGRNWQFTASYMGEPVSYGTGVDATERLAAVYFNEAPENWQRYRLGDAVAASSCVPALFSPIVIPDLFAGRAVRLVDGGVHDNQGARALLDQDCETLIVSDASGQMETQLNPSHAELGVILRTNSVLQSRVRIAQHQELQARERAHLLRGSVFLHLRKGVESTAQQAPTHAEGVVDTTPVAPAKPTTEYGIDRRVQLALSSLRTDLDSFTDREALTLMYSGYQMASSYLDPLASGTSATKVPWAFQSVADVANGENPQDESVQTLLQHLRVGSNIAFKVWRLQPMLRAIGILLLGSAAIAAIGSLIYLAIYHTHVQVPLNLGAISKSILITLGILALGALIPLTKAWIRAVRPLLNPGSAVAHIASGLLMATVGYVICRLHLCIFDRIFLRLGRLSR
jgi:predicted acylesterase/phospholipase RssA